MFPSFVVCLADSMVDTGCWCLTCFGCHAGSSPSPARAPIVAPSPAAVVSPAAAASPAGVPVPLLTPMSPTQASVGSCSGVPFLRHVVHWHRIVRGSLAVQSEWCALVLGLAHTCLSLCAVWLGSTVAVVPKLVPPLQAPAPAPISLVAPLSAPSTAMAPLAAPPTSGSAKAPGLAPVVSPRFRIHKCNRLPAPSLPPQVPPL